MSDEQLPPIEHHIEVEVGIERAWEFAADDIRAIRDQLANGWQSHVLPAFAAVATSGSGG